MATISVELSSQGMDDLIRQLTEDKNSLPDKIRRFVELLLEKGIAVAEEYKAQGTHTMPERVSFRKEIETEGGAVVALLMGVGEPFESGWTDSKGHHWNDMVYPLAMLEFGSAGYALVNPEETFGSSNVGRGTFSRSGNENKTSWAVERDDGRRIATAIVPTRPMYHAAVEMQQEIEKAAREAFGVE